MGPTASYSPYISLVHLGLPTAAQRFDFAQGAALGTAAI